MKTLAKALDVGTIRSRLGTMMAADAARWGTMSAGEAIVHLREAFLIATGERRADAVPVPLPGPMLKFLALRAPMPWPKGSPTVPGLERKNLITGSFGTDKEGLLRAYDDFLGMTSERPEHPMFGRMTRRDWMRWGYLHTDHHLRQFGR